MQQGGVPSSLPGEPSSFLNSDLMRLVGDVWAVRQTSGLHSSLATSWAISFLKVYFGEPQIFPKQKGRRRDAEMPSATLTPPMTVARIAANDANEKSPTNGIRALAGTLLRGP